MVWFVAPLRPATSAHSTNTAGWAGTAAVPCHPAIPLYPAAQQHPAPPPALSPPCPLRLPRPGPAFPHLWCLASTAWLHRHILESKPVSAFSTGGPILQVLPSKVVTRLQLVEPRGQPLRTPRNRDVVLLPAWRSGLLPIVIALPERIGWSPC